MAFADGVATFQILKDLRFIKMDAGLRSKLKKLIEADKIRTLTYEEELWIRKQYNRRVKQVRELHQMEQNARESDAKARRGSAKDKMLRLRAKRLTEKRLRDEQKRLESEIKDIEAEEQDFGI